MWKLTFAATRFFAEMKKAAVQPTKDYFFQ